jgi:hypothetical protein
MPIPQKGVDIIRESILSRDNAADGLIADLDKIEAAMIRLILRRLAEMSGTKDGLRLTAANAKRLNKLGREISEALKTQKYSSAVTNYLREFSELEKLMIDKHQFINSISIPKGFFNDLKQHSLTFAEERLIGEGFDRAFVDPLMERVGNLVLTGADFGDIEAELAAHITEGSSSLSRYLGQIATDTINQYNGAMDQRIGREFGLEWLVYSGSIIATSRPQCVRWAGKRYIHQSQLPAEIRWANNQGSGMIPGTTASTFVINTGGYRCRHDATWIDSDLVPADIRAAL